MLTALLLTSSVHAIEWTSRHQVAASYFPIGLRYAYRGESRMPLWDQPDSVLFEKTWLAPGMYFEATPAYIRAGPQLDFTPIAIFDVTLEAVGFAYFGSFSGVTVFDSPDAYFGSRAVQSAKAEGCTSKVGEPALCFPDAVITHEHGIDGKNGGYGLRLTASPTLKAKAGPIIVAIPAEIHRFMVSRPDGETGDWFYEPQLDALLGFKDTVLTSSPVLFYVVRDDTDDDPRFFYAGLRADYQQVLGSGDQSAKLGPMVVFDPGVKRAVPTFVAFTQAFLISPIHPTFPPYIAVAAIW